MIALLVPDGDAGRRAAAVGAYRAISNVREALLTEVSHLPLAVLSVWAAAPAGPSCAARANWPVPPLRAGPPA
jgi:hypothetical protein